MRVKEVKFIFSPLTQRSFALGWPRFCVEHIIEKFSDNFTFAANDMFTEGDKTNALGASIKKLYIYNNNTGLNDSASNNIPS